MFGVVLAKSGYLLVPVTRLWSTLYYFSENVPIKYALPIWVD
jgi:hypothetical protein